MGILAPIGFDVEGAHMSAANATFNSARAASCNEALLSQRLSHHGPVLPEWGGPGGVNSPA